MPIHANLAPIIVRLPFMALNFWLVEGPIKIIALSWTTVRSTANILSVPILIKTFFAPWKGEYRKGYVAIARGIGITIRLFTLTVGLIITAAVFLVGVILILAWILLPIIWTAAFILSITSPLTGVHLL